MLLLLANTPPPHFPLPQLARPSRPHSSFPTGGGRGRGGLNLLGLVLVPLLCRLPLAHRARSPLGLGLLGMLLLEGKGHLLRALLWGSAYLVCLPLSLPLYFFPGQKRGSEGERERRRGVRLSPSHSFLPLPSPPLPPEGVTGSEDEVWCTRGSICMSMYVVCLCMSTCRRGVVHQR